MGLPLTVSDYAAHEAAAGDFWTLQHLRSASVWRPFRNGPVTKFSPVLAQYLLKSEHESLCGDFANAMRLRAYFPTELLSAYLVGSPSCRLLELDANGDIRAANPKTFAERLRRMIDAEAGYWAHGRKLKIAAIHPKRASRLEEWAAESESITRVRGALRLACSLDVLPIRIMEALVRQAR